MCLKCVTGQVTGLPWEWQKFCEFPATLKYSVLSARVIAKKSRHGLPQVRLKNLITLKAFVGDSGCC